MLTDDTNLYKQQSKHGILQHSKPALRFCQLQLSLFAYNSKNSSTLIRKIICNPKIIWRIITSQYSTNLADAKSECKRLSCI